MTEQRPERPPRPTLRQVAALSGLSVKTVSRALNGEPYVSEETAQRVWTAAAQLGFRLNVMARELRSGAVSTTVGLLIGDLANPFWSGIARGVERELSRRGLRLITASTDEDPALEWSLTKDMLDRRVRALLVVPTTGDHSYLEAERRQGLAVVFLDRPPSHVLADVILLDNAGGARTAADHLLSHGHRRIAVIADVPRLNTHRERMAGFRDAMERAGVTEWEPYLRTEAHDAQVAEADTRDLMAMNPPPTALFTMNNWITMGALRVLKEWPAGTRAPALVGFDDLDLGDIVNVSVIQHDPEEMGRLAAVTALARMDGDEGPPRTVVMPTRLVARGSGERKP
jgi:LacI family transcriptional regulator, galactose operon repressor